MDCHNDAAGNSLPALSNRRSHAAALLVVLASFALGVSDQELAPSGDNLGTRALAASLATSLSFELSDAMRDEVVNYSMVDTSGRLRNSFPMGTAILATPVYFADAKLTGHDARALAADARLEKIASGLITACAAAVFFLAMARRFSLEGAICSTTLLVCATPALTTMSQGLWSHTGELLAIALAMLAVSSRTESSYSASLAGIFMGAAAFCRPTAVLLAGLPVAWLCVTRQRISYLSSFVATLALTLLANLEIYGSLLGQYGALSHGKFDFTVRSLASGFAGVLLSPSRGLVVYFPTLVAGLAMVLLWSRARRRLAVHCALASGAIIALSASYENWWGGHSVGPRLLGELSIPCALTLACALGLRGRRATRVLMFFLALIQSAIFLTLHFSPRASSWNLDVAVDANPKALWSLRNSQLFAALNPRWKYRETGKYFDKYELADSAAGYGWTMVDLQGAANARYDDSMACVKAAELTSLCLPRLADERLSASAHLRVLPPKQLNVVQACRGESSGLIEVGGVVTKKIDTLFQWRGEVTEKEKLAPAGTLIVGFGNGKQTYFPVRFGSEIVLRQQLDISLSRHRFYAGGMTAPDALQRQRFTLPGKNRVVIHLAFEVPSDGPDGCLFLLAAALGMPES